MEDNEMYDEFGNYIGPEIGVGSDSEQDSHNESVEQIDTKTRQGNQILIGNTTNDADELMQEDDEQFYKRGHQIVLHEDKQYYPDAENVYGPGVQALVFEEDAQPLTTPIIQPHKEANFQIYDKVIPETHYSLDYLTAVSQNADLIRNVVVCGHLHHGKTLLCDIFYEQAHIRPKKYDMKKEYKYTDNRRDEVERQMSLKCSTLTVLLSDSRKKNFLFNFADTPGHPGFSDEVTVGMRIADGMLLVVDCVEGVTCYVERLIKEALRANLRIITVLNKIDRLVLELKLPPTDAYYKLKHTLDEINLIIQSYSSLHQGKQPYMSPLNGNVVFASTQFGCSFSIQSFAQSYNKKESELNYEKHSQKLRSQKSLDENQFARFLWGDLFYNTETRKFTRASEQGSPRSFVHFILEPFYKLIAVSLSEEQSELEPVLAKIGVHLSKQDFALDIKPLLRLVLNKLLGDTTCLVDQMVKVFPQASKSEKALTTYPGDHRIFNEQRLCINVVKLFNNEVDGSFIAFGRVMSGTLHEGQDVKVLGENYTQEEGEDMYVAKAEKLWILQAGGRFRIQVSQVSAGNWIGIEGIDKGFTKTATIVAVNDTETLAFKKLDFNTESVVKVACEPLNPSDLPKMLEGLRKINKSYPMVQTKVEESGEHIIVGTSELYLDQILHDLRTLYADVEIKVSEPFVSISETVAEQTAVRCYAETPNRKNTLSMIAEPLEKVLAERIQSGLLSFRKDQVGVLADVLTKEFGWDELTASSVWAFGPSGSSNILVDYTLEGEVDKFKLNQARNSIVQGFQWAAREGPLCEEPMKNVKFKLIGCEFSTEPVYRSAGQIIPTARRVAYSAFLLASPRIMEPMFLAEVHCPQDCLEAIYSLLMRRRAHVIFSESKPGSPLTVLRVEIPGMETFGFETDLRTHTMGQAMVFQLFSHWSLLPGDPLDRQIQLRPLEPSQVPHLARELMVKTRRRKGLLEDVSVAKFFDSEGMLASAKQDPYLKAYF